MGFIRMSPSFTTAMTSRFMMVGAAPQGVQDPVSGRGLLCSHGGVSGVGARLAIMKGTIPTNFSGLTSYNARATDVLVLFDATGTTSSTGINQFTGSQDTVNPMVVTTTYVNATVSGLATWFWWLTTPILTSYTWNNTITPYNQIVGTIGTAGSGADLTLPNINIVAGSPHRIYNYRLQIPTSWTF